MDEMQELRDRVADLELQAIAAQTALLAVVAIDEAECRKQGRTSELAAAIKRNAERYRKLANTPDNVTAIRHHLPAAAARIADLFEEMLAP